MALKRDYKDTIVARIKRDRRFARLFYAGAIEMLLEGRTTEALSRLRDLVHAEITFKELARQTGLGEKTLHRMLNHNGNPSARNLGVIVRSIAEDLARERECMRTLKPCSRQCGSIPQLRSPPFHNGGYRGSVPGEPLLAGFQRVGAGPGPKRARR
ncbi:MAG: hypothetical protein ABSA69_05950 [Verrucomicrobiota bacterium]|jgi:DNA-binding phage protein